MRQQNYKEIDQLDDPAQQKSQLPKIIYDNVIFVKGKPQYRKTIKNCAVLMKTVNACGQSAVVVGFSKKYKSDAFNRIRGRKIAYRRCLDALEEFQSDDEFYNNTRIIFKHPTFKLPCDTGGNFIAVFGSDDIETTELKQYVNASFHSRLIREVRHMIKKEE